MRTRITSWLNRMPGSDPLERTHSLAIQTACLVAALALGVGLFRGVQVGAPTPLLVRDSVNLVIVATSVLLLRLGRTRIAWRLLVVGISANYLFWLALLGLEFNRYELLQLAISLTAMALLLGRRWLWLGFLAAAAAVVVAALRDAGYLWSSGPLPASVPAITLPGATIAVMGIIAVLLDRFGLTVRQALDAALVRERDLGRANLALRDEAAAHLRTSALLVESQKMEAIGRLAGGVAHDFNNILTSIVCSAHLARQGLLPQEPARADLDQVLDDAERAASLTRQLLAFARRQVVEPQRVNVAELVRRLEKMMRRLLGEDVELVIEAPHLAHLVLIDPGQLEQVLVNLTVNAQDAMPQGGVLSIRVKDGRDDPAAGARLPSPTATGEWILLEVTDNGVGMGPEVRDRVFEPFFTTKGQGRGTGLGLATCRSIVEQAGGTIFVSSEVGAGTTFRVYLPSASGAAEPAVEEQVRAVEGGSEVLLVVEDDPKVRSSAVRVLRGLGYQVLEADAVEEALAVATRNPGAIHLLVTDVVLRRGSGRDLATRLRVRRPDMKVLFVSGYTDDAIIRHGIEQRDVAFLAKPFAPQDLGRMVRDVLDARRRGPSPVSGDVA
ncbi:MAG TPA: ATP-binding protein [Anaeromyxobacteraceae bacterium]|nr:ATP-binding protein [Anaeromyxobacteraceae bacterium]